MNNTTIKTDFSGFDIACPECDLAINPPEPKPGQRAVCPRCGYVLTACVADPYGRALSFAFAAFIMLAVALLFPFLTITSAGIGNSMTLWQTVSYLASYGAEMMAILVFFFVLLVPSLILVATLTLAIALRTGRFPGWLLRPARWLYSLNFWSMVEVFCIGVIVSLVKIVSLARVELGIAFWAYLAFSALFLMAFSSLDRLTVWTAIERLRAQA